ncbi:hypothetical protein BH20CHL7_BH20CHL7_09580 [soil metagenome]
MVPPVSVELATPQDLGVPVAGVPRGRARLRWRLLAIGVAPTIVILLAMVVVYVALDRTVRVSQGLTQSRNVITAIVLLRQAVVDQETAVRGYAIAGDVSFLEPYDAGAAAFQEVLESVQPHIAGDPGNREAVARIVDLHDHWTTEIAEREIAAVRSGDLESARQLIGTRSGKAITDEIRAIAGTIIAADDVTLVELRRMRDDAADAAVTAIILGPLVAAIVLLAVLIVTTRRVTRDVEDVTRAAAALAAGDLAARAPVRSDDEIGILAAGLNNMAVRLERSMAVEQAVSAELREQAAALAAANQELESFSYSVSHDLRAPLRAIDGFSQVLVEDHGPSMDAEATRVLGRVRAASQRMAGLIDDLLSLSRVARAPLQASDVDLTAIAEEQVRSLRRAAPDRVVDVYIEPGLRAFADPGLAAVVLDNLLSNAWKFSARTDGARIDLERVDEHIMRVRDNGAGFDPRYRSKLFQPFQRLHREDEFPGTGIGLATVRRVLRRHGGDVTATGRPGKGATVSFSFDRPVPAEAEAG